MKESNTDYELGCVLGCGAFGKVRKAINKETGKKVAIKFLMKKKIRTDEDKKRVQRQTAILKKIQHPNLLKLLQVIDTDQSYLLVTQLVEGQELFQKINRLGKLDQESAGNYFVQLLDAVLYLQSLSICHRDIKPQNIIVRGKKLKLIDFGLGNFYQKGQMLKTSCGSPCYAAPEMMSQKCYDPSKTEIWALGVTLYAMLTGSLPFQHTNTAKLYKIMASGSYQEIDGISSSLKSLLRAMIQPKPNLRIDIDDICSHVWVRSFKYKFYNPTSIQWNNQILTTLSQKLRLNKQQTIKRIKYNFGYERVYYYLSNQNARQNILRGPIHLSLTYFSLQSAKNEVKLKYDNLIWKTDLIGQNQHFIIQIKNISNNIYTLCFKSKQ